MTPASPSRLAAAALLTVACAARVPPVVEAERAHAPPGTATVVEFIDFECPYCRALGATLAPLLAARAGHVHVVRKQVPLTRAHPHAMDAARVSVCADAMGRGDAVADALLQAPPGSLTGEGTAQLGQAQGLDPAALRACLADPRTDEQIRSDTEAFFVGADGEGVPTLWIEDRVFVGAADAATLGRALDEAIARRR